VKDTLSAGKLRGIGVAGGYKNVCYSFGFPKKASARCELYGDSQIERAAEDVLLALKAKAAHG